MTCLDGSNTKCGTFSTATGCSVASASGRQYIRQSAVKTLSNGSTSWTFPWKAPAGAAGDQATFYFVSLPANGNGNKTGDNVLQATKSVVFKTNLVATQEKTTTEWVRLYPTVVQDLLQVHLLDSSDGTLDIIDQQGQVVLHVTLSAVNSISVNQLPKGLYFACIGTKEKRSTRKFVVL